MSHKIKNLLKALKSVGGEMSLTAVESGYPNGMAQALKADLIVCGMRTRTDATGREWSQPTIKLAGA